MEHKMTRRKGVRAALIITLFLCVACTSGIQSSVEDMKGQMGQLNDKVGRMERSARETADTSKEMAGRDTTGDLKFSEAYSHILDDNNLRYLIPFPVEMIPDAVMMSRQGEIEDILAIVKSWLEAAWTADLDDAYEGRKDRQSEIEADRFKLARLQAIKGVCGTIPGEKWETLVAEEYLKPGRFNEIAEICLWARAAFLKGELLTEPNYNLVILENSIETLEGVERLFEVVGQDQISADLHLSFYQKRFRDFVNGENPVKARDVLHIWDVLTEAPEIIMKRNPDVDHARWLELKKSIKDGRARALGTLAL